MTEHTANCELCRQDGKPESEYRMPTEEIMTHLRVEHMQDERVHGDDCPKDGTCDCLEPATWPDGEVVVMYEPDTPEDINLWLRESGPS